MESFGQHDGLKNIDNNHNNKPTRINALLNQKSPHCGSIIFVFCSLASLAKAISLILIFTAFLPGFIYGLVLVNDITDGDSKYNSGLLFLWSGLLYVGCFFVTNLRNNDLFMVTLIPASASGSLLLFMGYYFIVSKNFKFLQTCLLAVLLGAIAALPSATAHLWLGNHGGNAAFCGVFLIYPTWQTAFSVLLIKCKTNPVIDERL